MATELEALARTALLVQTDYFPCASLEEIVAVLAGYRVSISADETALATAAGRTALVATFIAAAQLGANIRLDVPPGIIDGNQPPLQSGDLAESLLHHGRELIIPPSRLAQVDCSFAFGARTAEHDFVVSGDSWGSRLDLDRARGSWTGELPFGGLFAAALASAEVFRGALRQLAAHHPTPSNLRLQTRPSRLNVPPLPLTPDLDLGDVDFVSAGAITHSALAVLFRLDGLAGRLRIMDDDRYAVSNLNRYALISRPLVGHAKAAPLVDYARDGLEIVGVPVRVCDETMGSIGGLSARVCVGVDEIPARWFVQDRAPGWVGVGATSHLFAMASSHPHGTPCAGCLHPKDDPQPMLEIPTVSFVSLLGGVLLAYRLIEDCLARPATASSTQILDAMNLASPSTVLSREVPRSRSCPARCLNQGKTTATLTSQWVVPDRA